MSSKFLLTGKTTRHISSSSFRFFLLFYILLGFFVSFIFLHLFHLPSLNCLISILFSLSFPLSFLSFIHLFSLISLLKSLLSFFSPFVLPAAFPAILPRRRGGMLVLFSLTLEVPEMQKFRKIPRHFPFHTVCTQTGVNSMQPRRRRC